MPVFAIAVALQFFLAWVLGVACGGLLVVWWMRHQAKQQAVAHQHQLTQQTNKLRSVNIHLEAAQTRAQLGSWEYFPDQETGYWSQQMYRLFDLEMGTPVPNVAAFLARIHPDDVGLVQRAWRGAMVHAKPVQVDFRLHPDLNPKVRWRSATIDLVQAEEEGADMLAGTVSDVTRRKNDEAALQHRNRELEVLLTLGQQLVQQRDQGALFAHLVQAVVEGIPAAEAASLWLLDADPMYIKPHVWIGHSDEVLTGLVLPATRSFIKQTLASGTPLLVKNVQQSPHFEALHPALDRVQTLLAMPLVLDGQPIGFLSADNFARPAAFDENDQRLLQAMVAQAVVALENIRLLERIRLVSLRILEAQETERRHIAQELHDEIGGWLTALQISLRTAEHTSTTEPRLQPAMEVVSSLTEQVRNVALNLRPSMLDDLGLSAALQWFAKRYTQQTGVHVRLHDELPPQQRFVPTIETTAFRIVQEALTNVARHAAVPEAQVLVHQAESRLILHIIDEGGGFEIEPSRSNQTLGLSGMRERAELVRGTLTIQSEQGCGTRVSAWLPV